ncbi:hypothetical protein QJS83_14925 [Bdellovibrio sp. 22V]|uniref:hypothetical protein n=1 Tax=Bdellovibrio sp. 22V TaxID=3044166 RepID=UPI002542CD02|nr:hypothetical protein [Bdellovibrio sp. 22V]WII71756.1 hypothetical protein QJS83_14925 [Bdellovibrio sp. 22V]
MLIDARDNGHPKPIQYMGTVIMVPRHAKWVAIDADGVVWAYLIEDEPPHVPAVRGATRWCTMWSNDKVFCGAAELGGVNWKETLMRVE